MNDMRLLRLGALPPANMPLVAFDTVKGFCVATCKSPKSCAFPVDENVMNSIVFVLAGLEPPTINHLVCDATES